MLGVLRVYIGRHAGCVLRGVHRVVYTQGVVGVYLRVYGEAYTQGVPQGVGREAYTGRYTRVCTECIYRVGYTRVCTVVYTQKYTRVYNSGVYPGGVYPGVTGTTRRNEAGSEAGLSSRFTVGEQIWPPASLLVYAGTHHPGICPSLPPFVGVPLPARPSPAPRSSLARTGRLGGFTLLVLRLERRGAGRREEGLSPP